MLLVVAVLLWGFSGAAGLFVAAGWGWGLLALGWIVYWIGRALVTGWRFLTGEQGSDDE